MEQKNGVTIENSTLQATKQKNLPQIRTLVCMGPIAPDTRPIRPTLKNPSPKPLLNVLKQANPNRQTRSQDTYTRNLSKNRLGKNTLLNAPIPCQNINSVTSKYPPSRHAGGSDGPAVPVTLSVSQSAVSLQQTVPQSNHLVLCAFGAKQLVVTKRPPVMLTSICDAGVLSPDFCFALFILFPDGSKEICCSLFSSFLTKKCVGFLIPCSFELVLLFLRSRPFSPLFKHGTDLLEVPTHLGFPNLFMALPAATTPVRQLIIKVIL